MLGLKEHIMPNPKSSLKRRRGSVVLCFDDKG